MCRNAELPTIIKLLPRLSAIFRGNTRLIDNDARYGLPLPRPNVFGFFEFRKKLNFRNSKLTREKIRRRQSHLRRSYRHNIGAGDFSFGAPVTHCVDKIIFEIAGDSERSKYDGCVLIDNESPPKPIDIDERYHSTGSL